MKLAIQGHLDRGKEIIQIFESLGGINRMNHSGRYTKYYYYISGDDNTIAWTCIRPEHLNVFTLEEFEKEFPFKVGDKVKHITSIGIIKEYCYIDNEPAYKVKSIELGIIATIPVKILEPYKEMERNITLTLNKAKEWYNKGGELREIALQAFTEKELNPLPRSWEEFCKKYPIKNNEAHFDSLSNIVVHKDISQLRSIGRDRNICPSQKSAEAHLAMIQLEQLRDCWRQGWKPKEHEPVYTIKFSVRGLCVYQFNSREFLSFPTKEMAEEFLKCFRDLIEKAGDLI